MSLVGSLEDLGLGDILQIICLSGKSGLLSLHSDQGEGQLLFRDGAIRAAYAKDAPADLRDLLAHFGTMAPDDLDTACEDARQNGRPLEDVLVEGGLKTSAELDELRRGHIERVVLGMFTWPTGEFSFEVADATASGSPDLVLATGMNPQFLAMEGTRMRDEAQRGGDASGQEEAPLDFDALDGSDDDFLLGTEPTPETAEAIATGSEAAPTLETETETAPDPPPAAQTTDADATADDPLAELGFDEGDAPASATSPVVPTANPAVVVIDEDLRVLEWVKQSLSEDFPRVHIFQRPELGVGRIRQYLSRAELPLLLLSATAPADPLTGARNADEIAARLRAQSARMTIVVFGDAPGLAEGVATARAERPTPTQLADPRQAPQRDELAVRLRDVLLGTVSGRGGGESAPTVEEGRTLGIRLRDESDDRELVEELLRFAGRSFNRVALFALAEDELVAIAQRGLSQAGGPGNAGLSEVHLPQEESSWVRKALASAGAVRAAPGDDGDHRLAVMLGNTIADEAWLAPLGASPPAGLLYGDNLPGGDLIADTAALEAALEELAPRLAAGLPGYPRPR